LNSGTAQALRFNCAGVVTSEKAHISFLSEIDREVLMSNTSDFNWNVSNGLLSRQQENIYDKISFDPVEPQPNMKMG